MDWSSMTSLDKQTSLARGGNSDLQNQLDKRWSRIGTLTSLLLCRHSWMWSEMWVVVSWRSEVKISVPVLYLIGNWKFLRNSVAKAPKVLTAPHGSSIYHLATFPVRLRGKIRSWILSSTMDFETDHRWKVVTCVVISSPCFLLNLWMSDGILCGTGGQSGLWLTGSLVSL